MKSEVKSSTLTLIADKLVLDPTEEEISICDYYFSNIKFNNDESNIIFKYKLVLMFKIKGESINSDMLFNSFSME